MIFFIKLLACFLFGSSFDGFTLLLLRFQLSLFVFLFRDILVILNGLFKRFIEETAIVDQRHCHVATKSGHFLKVHTRLTDDFRYIAVLECIDYILILGLVTISLRAIVRLSILLTVIVSFFENFMGNGCLFLAQHAVDHEFVTL